MQSPFKDRLLLTAFLVILLAFGLLVARKYFISTPPPQPVATVPAPEEPRQRREVVLYFGNPDGTHLVPESREVSDCLVESDCVRETVQALINGPLGNSIPIIPSHSVLRGIALENGTAILDFSRDLVTGHPGGSISELLTVYGLANTVAVNFPHLRQVRILIEGATVETLKGHLGLQEPVTA
ncbi:MAG: GerMN domain-containing protein, partial [Desulfuromonadales bacterium]|nr:GerMN domain-containing protein [Desulfuromonadales bacterium]